MSFLPPGSWTAWAIRKVQLTDYGEVIRAVIMFAVPIWREVCAAS